MRTFTINRNPNDCGVLYYRSEMTFKPGVTVLVGCNGSGKTSLLNMLESRLNKEEVPCISFDNLHDGGHNAVSKAAFYEDFNFVANAVTSSEGENIVLNMGNKAREMGAFSKKNDSAKELWFLFDAVDSGLSVDNIVDVKEFLFKTIIEHNKDKDIYIIISANEYELCRKENCFDIYLGKYVKFKDYEEYRKFILDSRARKEKREDKEFEKAKKAMELGFKRKRR